MYILERSLTSRDSGQPPFFHGTGILRDAFLARKDHEQERAERRGAADTTISLQLMLTRFVVP